MSSKRVKELAEKRQRERLMEDLPEGAVVILDDFVGGKPRYLDGDGKEVTSSE